MGSLSYCVIENVLNDLHTMHRVLIDLVNREDVLNESEGNALPNAIAMMKDIVALYEESVTDGIIDANGTLVEEE